MILILFSVCANYATVSANGKIPTSSHPIKLNNNSKEILVRFKPGTKVSTIKKIQEKLGLVTVKTLNVHDLYLMKVIKKTPVESIIKKLNGYDEVMYAEPDLIYKTNAE